MGQVYSRVIARECRGVRCRTVQVVPDVTDEIVCHLVATASLCTDDSGLPLKVAVIVLDGTVGDIEVIVLLEALRRLCEHHSVRSTVTSTAAVRDPIMNGPTATGSHVTVAAITSAAVLLSAVRQCCYHQCGSAAVTSAAVLQAM